MPAKRTALDACREAVILLVRADVHLEWFEQADNCNHSAELISKLRADINTFLKKKAPTNAS